MIRRALAAGLGLALVACAGHSPTLPDQESRAVAYAHRASQLEAFARWSLTARLGLDDGQDGGSGRLQWGVDGPSSTLDFRGTLGRGAWRLALDRDGATLSRADGSVVHDPSVSELIRRESGLMIPVGSLHWWVRGLARPGAERRLELDASGLPAELHQDGWMIRYDRYMEEGEMLLPRKLVATRGEYRVKLVISRWAMPAGDSDA